LKIDFMNKSGVLGNMIFVFYTRGFVFYTRGFVFYTRGFVFYTRGFAFVYYLGY